jgi:hypothetical protein
MAVNINGTGSITGLSSISSPGISGVPVGSASAPAFSFTGDTNTGIYSPGADQVAVATNGTGRLFVDANGNVGVGTSSAARAAILTTKAANQSIASGNGLISVITSNSQAADVGGSIVLGGQSTDADWVYASLSGRSENNSYAGYLAFATSASGGQHNERMRITAAGNVGIGTSSPSARLNIAEGNANAVSTTSTDVNRVLLTDTSGSTSAGAGYSLDFEGAYGGLGRIAISKSNSATAGTSRDAGAFRLFLNQNLGEDSYAAFTEALTIDSNGTDQGLIYRFRGTEQIRVDNSGRLLVGTSSARATWAFSTDGSLQVERSNYAAMQVVGNANTTSGAYLSFLKSRGGAIGGTTIVQNNDELGWISFEGMDGANPKAGAAIVAFVDGTPGANDMPGRLVFSTTADGASTPTERMRIGRNGFTKCAGNSTLHDASGLYHEFISNTDVSGPIIFCRQRAGAGSQRGIDVYYDAVLNSANNAFFTGQDSGATRIQLYSNGGIANFSANDVNLSDRNVKKDISPTGGTWECLKEWEIVRFRYKESPLLYYV